jgi:hypothetical protein
VTANTSGGRPLWGRMTGRDPKEPHRVATPLELLSDLCFVVAVAHAAASLHHALSEGHAGTGVLGYAMVFSSSPPGCRGPSRTRTSGWSRSAT